LFSKEKARVKLSLKELSKPQKEKKNEKIIIICQQPASHQNYQTNIFPFPKLQKIIINSGPRKKIVLFLFL
jgi:hypothetical protein